ncbi:MAG: DUF4261 domain-containing protein [Myxococcales bacterium]|nr:DUF4261 domain-containing protein [Myxococcales bacterium]
MATCRALDHAITQGIHGLPLMGSGGFTSLLAALLRASSGLGVYWHHATHRPEFFLDLARAEDTRPRIMLWSGISVGHEEGDRVSILSWLLEDLGLPDLLVTAPRDNGPDAMDSFFDILAYVVDRKEPIPDGDTFGRTEHERIRVRYVPSPADAERRVCCIDLPEV